MAPTDPPRAEEAPQIAPQTAAVIVAAGRGLRAGGDIPKQWQTLGNRRVIDFTLESFAASPFVDDITVVLHPDDMGLLEDHAGLTLVPGGPTRAASVRAGLEALEPAGPDRVLIHDAARACIDSVTIAAVATALDTAPAAAPGLGVTDALWIARDGQVTGTQERGALFRAQTPQGFHFAPILEAHRRHPGGAADDVEVARWAGLDVAIVPGAEDNLKITTPADFARADRILRGRMPPAPPDIRTGNGFDVHAFGPGDHVMLCGVAIPHEKGLLGHSDADVGLHTITDAIYGALAEGDIGRHFPPSDPQWKGAASRIFLEHAVALAGSRGYRITHLDCTLICEHPKIGPHAGAMTAAVSEITGVEPGRISIKATTSERLGFTGRGEGIAALATVTLAAP